MRPGLRDKRTRKGLHSGREMNRARILTLQTGAALLLPLMIGCVKKSEYDALQVENQTLQTRVDQTSHQLTESQSDVTALQQQVQKLLTTATDLLELKVELKKSQQEVGVLQGRLKAQESDPDLKEAQLALKKSQQDYKILLSHYDQFLSERRTAMVGRKYTELKLDNGKVLQGAEITAVSPDEISIKHAEGLAKLPLAKSPPELRWDVCLDLQERRDLNREAIPTKSADKAARLAVAPSPQPKQAPAPAVIASAPPSSSTAADALRAQLAAQRAALNTEYQALAARNAAALRGVPWDTAQPEASPLLNSLSGGRAVLGISRLQSYRSAIISTLQQLRDVDPSAR